MISLEKLIAHYDARGYDWNAEERGFYPRPDGPAADGLYLSERAAREQMLPLNRDDEIRGR